MKRSSSVVAKVPRVKVAVPRVKVALSGNTARQGQASTKGELLTKKQVQELHLRLQALKVELLEKINGKHGTFQEGLDGESLIKGDDAEVAEKQRASNAALQELDFFKNRLLLVGRALAKIAAGEYGYCEETDEPIGYERLCVVPWARYAVHVQELRERRQREYKVSRLRSEA